MYNSVFILFLVIFNLILISICCTVYLFKTILQGVRKAIEREMELEELKNKQKNKE